MAEALPHRPGIDRAANFGSIGWPQRQAAFGFALVFIVAHIIRSVIDRSNLREAPPIRNSPSSSGVSLPALHARRNALPGQNPAQPRRVRQNYLGKPPRRQGNMHNRIATKNGTQRRGVQ